MSKERLTVTVDPEWVQAGNEAVTQGRADSLSAWVNAALAEQVARDRRLRALADAVAAYEQQFGPMAEAELAAQQRADRAAARVVRSPGPWARPRRRPRRGVA